MLIYERDKIKKSEFFEIDASLSNSGINFFLNNKPTSKNTNNNNINNNHKNHNNANSKNNNKNNKKFSIKYPKEIWNSVSDKNKQILLDNLTFALSCHLPAANNEKGKKGIIYKTALPCFESFIFKSTIYDIPSTALIDNKKTSNYMKRFFNSQFYFKNYDTKLPITKPNKQKENKKRINKQKTAIILFSAGKESLLTLAMCKELNIRPILVYIDECDSENYHEYETIHKNKIIKKLKKEQNIEVYTIKNKLNEFQFNGYFDDMEFNNWGFGAMLTIFLLEVIPFAHKFNADYIFFGNEFSCDHNTINEDGWKTNYIYDQSSEWVKNLNIISRLMTDGKTQVGSLVSPLFELGLIKILHEKYPDLAKLQMSCFADTEHGEHNRWCCNCSKCARLYVFFKALNIKPDRVNLDKCLFAKKYRKLFSVFGSHDDMVGFDQSGLGAQEQQLAFMMAIENKVNGALIEEFKLKPKYQSLIRKKNSMKYKFF